MSSRRASFAALALIVLAVAAVAVHFVRQARVDPEVPFFVREAPAEWIVFPSEPSTYTRARVELATSFTRTFELAAAPRSATLQVKLHVDGDVVVNGAPVTLLPSDASNWKRERSADVTTLLHAGSNTVSATARASFGPGAVWLVLECDGTTLVSDASWSANCAGSSVRAARLAATPMDEWARPTTRSKIGELHSNELNPSPLSALRKSLPNLVALAAAAAALVFGLRALTRKYALVFERRATWLFSAVAALLLALLFWNNRALGLDQGFDAAAHVEYVNYLLRTGSVPLAHQGWEMYQPPLYYAVVAFAVKLSGAATLDAQSMHVVRVVGWAALVLQILFVTLGLRELFAERPRTAFVGACVAALLPMQLYLFQYASNEGFAAMLVSAALWLALRILRRENARVRDFAVLGLVLGAALLTKFSALLVVLLVLGVFAGRVALRRERVTLVQLRNLVALPLVIALVCGWYYLRVHERFGRFFVGNFDAEAGFAWWQDPGYRTSCDFTRFGAVFEHPLFSSLHSCGDALYSTLFGDALIGGSGRVDARPPWNYELMSAGMLLALLPTLALGIGLVIALVRLVREPRASWFLVLGLQAGTLAALISLTLRLPFYAQTKAVYAASVMIPLAAAIALGCEWIVERVRAAAPVVWIVLTTWLLASLTTFWSTDALAFENRMPREPAEWALPDAGSDARGGVAALEQAAAQAPDNADAHAQLASVRLGRGDVEAATAAARDAVAIDPWNPAAHYVLALVRHRGGDTASAVEQLQLAVSIEPRAAPFALDLATLLIAARRFSEAEIVLERTRAALAGAGQPVPPAITERLALCRKQR